MSERNYFFKLTGTEVKYTEEHLVKTIAEIIGRDSLSKEDIYEEVVRRYGGIKVNYSAFKMLLEERFLCNDKLYSQDISLLNDSASNIVDKSVNKDSQKTEYVSVFNKYASVSVEQLYKEFYKLISKTNIDVVEILTLILAIENKKGVLNINACANICIYVNNNKKTILYRIQNVLEQIMQENYKIPCAFFIHDECVLRMLESEHIYTAGDVSVTRPEIILALSAVDIEDTLNEIESLKVNFFSGVCKTINDVVTANITDRYYDIALKRNGYFTSKIIALEAIGDEYGITRERVRQLESKANKKLKNASMAIKDTVVYYFSILFGFEDNVYIRVKDVLLSGGDKDTIINACLLLKYLDINYRYDEKYHIVYDSTYTSAEEIEKGITEKFGNLIAVSRYEAATEFEKEVIDNNYVLSGRQHNLFRYNKYNQTAYLIDLITELFPNGYRIYNNDDYSLFASEYSSRLGDDVEVPSQVAVRGIVSRDGGQFCLIDRGTYKLRSECTVIPLELIDSIFDFIIDHLPLVEYITIFKTFEHELGRYGIDNHFYMKGVIDSSLPDDLLTKRDYITEKENRITAVEDRLNFMRSFKSTFTQNDLMEKYPGVKPYVFQLLCCNEEKNGLIHIGFRRFIYSKNINISDSQANILKDILEETFNNSDTAVISSGKIYARLKSMYSDLLDELTMIDGQYSTFSILKYLFHDEFFFDRPFISKEKPDEEKITTRGIILNYLEGLESISYDNYKEFCLRMNIPMAFTYMQLVDVLCDDYVQIDARQLIKKGDLNITVNDLSEFENILEMIFEREGKLETEDFNGYRMFPQIKYRWNKHMLAGIIRSFFGERYEVKNITNSLRPEALDYVIERYAE